MKAISLEEVSYMYVFVLTFSDNLWSLLATLFKKFKAEFVSLEGDGEILKSYKDSTLKGVNHTLQLAVS